MILVYLGFKLGLAHIVAQSVLIQMDDLQPANRRLLRKGCRHGNGLRGQHDPKTASNSRLNKLKLRIFGDFFFLCRLWNLLHCTACCRCFDQLPSVWEEGCVCCNAIISQTWWGGSNDLDFSMSALSRSSIRV